MTQYPDTTRAFLAFRDHGDPELAARHLVIAVESAEPFAQRGRAESAYRRLGDRNR